MAYNVTIDRGLNPHNGTAVAQAMWNSTFPGKGHLLLHCSDKGKALESSRWNNSMA